MKDVFLYLMIYAGSVLMAYNIYRYICFSRDVRKHGNWDREQRLFNLPIIAMTANAFQEDVRKAGEAGMNGHIAKPLDISDMRATLKRVLKKTPG